VQALELWPQHKNEIALVVTDMVMPGGVSGRELAQQLHREQAGLKMIYTSGYSTDIAGKDFPLQAGVNFLPKPFNPAELARLIRNTLDEPAGAPPEQTA
jgi:two-component system cell cycle sensor histidine kinase/response regulator CckA